MGKILKETIHANGFDIGIYTEDFQNEYISLTDIAKKREGEYPGYVIQNWLRSKSTVSFIGLWEKLHNPDFNCLEFEAIKKEAGENSFVLTPKRWVESVNAKLNYRIHTDAIKDNLIPPELTQKQISYTYANEADLLNVVLFGKTAKQWRDENKKLEGNIRDYASLQQLLVLANMESYNAILIKQDCAQEERMKLLHELAVQQMKTLGSLDVSGLPQIEDTKTNA